MPWDEACTNRSISLFLRRRAALRCSAFFRFFNFYFETLDWGGDLDVERGVRLRLLWTGGDEMERAEWRWNKIGPVEHEDKGCNTARHGLPCTAPREGGCRNAFLGWVSFSFPCFPKFALSV